MASVKGRPPNKGSFQKGNDQRRNVNGQINKSAIAFRKTLRELIVKEGEKIHAVTDPKTGSLIKAKKVEWMIRSLWSSAMGGEAWATQFIAERIEGKITQPIGQDPAMPFGKISIFEYGTLDDNDAIPSPRSNGHGET